MSVKNIELEKLLNTEDIDIENVGLEITYKVGE